ncbi:interaptin-like [Onthophagus taurus]|uniref:interaptin-like n=1 Tax=Onthophagus taurus TaxID=166361 RepID=UPI0039BE3375
MSILKKFLASNLTRYEEQQKRRYKKYLKIQKSNAKETPKTEAELYEDYIERQKSLRLSKQKAPLPREEIIFKEPNSGLNLGPAPALLEATNNFVVVDSILPEDESKKASIECNIYEEIAHPPIPVRRKPRKSFETSQSYYEEEKPPQEAIEKHQSIEIGRVSMSTDSDLYYDCISNQTDFNEEFQFNDIKWEYPEETKPKGVNLMTLNEEINNAWRGSSNQNGYTVENMQIQNEIWSPQELTIKESNFEPNQDIKFENYDYDDDVFMSSDNETTTELIQSFNDFAVIGTKEVESEPKLLVSKEKIKLNQLTNYFDPDENEGTILDNEKKSFSSTSSPSSTSSSSSEGDVFEKKPDRKVNFDFANSFCTTYERPRQLSSYSDDSAEDENQVLQPLYFNDEYYNQKDHVYKNFGIENKTILSPIYENINENNQSMDLVLLSCQNGYHHESEINETEDDEELDQFSEEDSLEFDINRDKRFQEYYDNIGDFNGKTDKNTKEDLFSIPKIENELDRIKQTGDDVNVQIDKIHLVLNKISEQIDYLESKDDEQYTPLLKLLLLCMKILGNLNCNFDEETLKSQKINMEYIRKCITTLKEKQQPKNTLDDYI